MFVQSALFAAVLGSQAHAGIIIGNFNPNATILHMEAESPLPPWSAQVVEGLTLTSCDATNTWSAPLQAPIFVTDWAAFVVPQDDWCTAELDLGPETETVELKEAGDLMVGDFGTDQTVWDIAVGLASAIL